MIKITNRGIRGTGVYVGRPSPFGNPFPTKKSKYGKKIYTLRKSLELYKKYFEEKLLYSEEFTKLVELYKKEGEITLDCWCVNREISRAEEIDLNNLSCHAEIIAYYLLRV